MTRILQILLVLLAAFLFAGCSAWQRVKAKREWQQFQREWGVPACFHGDPPRYYFPTTHAP